MEGSGVDLRYKLCIMSADDGYREKGPTPNSKIYIYYSFVPFGPLHWFNVRACNDPSDLLTMQ